MSRTQRHHVECAAREALANCTLGCWLLLLAPSKMIDRRETGEGLPTAACASREVLLVDARAQPDSVLL